MLLECGQHSLYKNPPQSTMQSSSYNPGVPFWYSPDAPFFCRFLPIHTASPDDTTHTKNASLNSSKLKHLLLLLTDRILHTLHILASALALAPESSNRPS